MICIEKNFLIQVTGSSNPDHHGLESGTKAVYSASDSGKRISTTGPWGIKGWNCEDLQDIPRKSMDGLWLDRILECSKLEVSWISTPTSMYFEWCTVVQVVPYVSSNMFWYVWLCDDVLIDFLIL